MIRINLLPFRVARKKREYQEADIYFIIVNFLTIMTLVWYTTVINKQILTIKEQTKQVNHQILKYKKKADRVGKIKKDLKILEEKLEIVSSLKKQTGKQLILFDGMTNLIVPERMWLESFKTNENKVTIKGIAFDNPTIADFMEKLENSSIFGKVDLKAAKIKKYKDGIMLKSFELLCTKEESKKRKRLNQNKGGMTKEKSKINEVRKRLNQFLEKLGALTKMQWLLIYFIIFVAIGGTYYYFIFMPKHTELKREKSNYASQLKKLSTYKKRASELKKYEALLAQKTEGFNLAMEALPDKRELPSLLTSISKAGSDAGLAFHLFQPTNEVNKKFFKEIPFSIKVQGRYHQMTDFFFQVKNLNRIVNINNVEVKSKKKGGSLLEMSCKAVTYMFVEKEQSTDKNNKKRKKK